VRTTRQLTERVSAMLERWDEVLIQRYVEGREVNVGILGDAVLPIAEIDFGRMPKGMWRIVTYKSKWETGSEEDLGSAPRCPARRSGRSPPTRSSPHRPPTARSYRGAPRSGTDCESRRPRWPACLRPRPG